jgi:phospholipid/cholesterol/gamma-HCH transport system permease protein
MPPGRTPVPEPRATAAPASPGGVLRRAVELIGDWADFSVRALGWTLRRRPGPGTFVPVCYAVGVKSVPVVAVTGMFIGMVLAVQAYGAYRPMGLQSWMGTMINMAVIRELGPVLAATMVAGRVGSAMAAELGTMRVTDQIDALACLGVDPIHHLVVPRLLACVLLTPLLTVMSNCLGIVGGALICLGVYGVESHHYWTHARDFIELWDLGVSMFKPAVFGAFIGLISCHRGFNSKGGSEGVGRAATEAFVFSFLAILVLDFFMGLFLNSLHDRLFGPVVSKGG